MMFLRPRYVKSCARSTQPAAARWMTATSPMRTGLRPASSHSLQREFSYAERPGGRVCAEHDVKSVPDRARTYNLRLRRPTLCPIELREHARSFYPPCPQVQRGAAVSTWASRCGPL